MKRIHCQDFQNDVGETFEGAIEKASELGSDTDEAFVRGREYARKKRQPYAIKAATKNKPKAIYTAMLDGYNWQKRRMK